MAINTQRPRGGRRCWEENLPKLGARPLHQDRVMGYIILIVSLYLLYKCCTAIYYFYYLQSRLRDANLAQFKSKLGKNYHYKVLSGRTVRYKWRKGWITIRAIFNEKGELIQDEKQEFNFLVPVSSFYFSKSV